MDEKNTSPKYLSDRWKRFTESSGFRVTICLVFIVYKAYEFRGRLFSGGGWSYPLAFLFYAVAVGLLFRLLLIERAPTRHMGEREFEAFRFRSAFQLSSLLAIYNLFDDSSDHHLNTNSVVGTAVVSGLMFILGMFAAKNPPAGDVEPALQDGLRPS